MDQKSIKKILSILQESETLGENVLRDRSEIVQMDRIRQKNREALSAMKHQNDDDSIYLCVGNMFIKRRMIGARSLVQDDQQNVNEHIEELRKKIKNNVQKIQEIEGKAEKFGAFNLNPLSPTEMKSFGVILESITKLDLEK